MLSRLWESSRSSIQRQHLLQVGQERGAQQRSARRGPVAVALDGVDLAVVGEVAIRVCEAPLRQGVVEKR